MPIPVPGNNEERSDFLSRCVSVVEAEGKSGDQAVAICMSRYTQDNKPAAIVVRDQATYAISRREWTDNGYLKVPGRVAKSGVQQYLAAELGIEGRNPTERVGVYRPADEVFSRDSLASYADVDVTIEHPGDMVNAETFSRHSVGHVTDAAKRDGEYVEAPLIIKDADAIREVEAGKVELSAGYLAEYVPESGTTDAGEPYEFVQKNIRINHVALVSSARAGRQARLYDEKPQEAVMHQVTMDGTSVEVADKSTATLIQAQFDSLQKRVGDSEKQASDAKAAKDAAEAKSDKLSEDNESLKSQVSDEAINERVKSIHDAQAAASKLAGDKFSCDSLDPMTIKREALKIVRDSIDWSQKSDEYVAAAFDMSYGEKAEEEDEEDKRKKSASDSAAKFGADLGNAKPGDAKATIDSAYEQYMQRKVAASQEAN